MAVVVYLDAVLGMKPDPGRASAGDSSSVKGVQQGRSAVVKRGHSGSRCHCSGEERRRPQIR